MRSTAAALPFLRSGAALLPAEAEERRFPEHSPKNAPPARSVPQRNPDLAGEASAEGLPVLSGSSQYVRRVEP